MARRKEHRKSLQRASAPEDEAPKGASPHGAEPRAFGYRTIAGVFAIVLGLVMGFGAVERGLLFGFAPPPPRRMLAEGSGPASGGEPAKTAPSLKDSVSTLANRLSMTPDDRDGWLLLGRSYMIMGRFDEAVAPLTNAQRLDPGNPDIQVLLGEAMVRMSANGIPPEAVTLFEAALSADPGHPLARYFLALAAFQAGNRRRAVTQWRTLLAETPADAPWREATRRRLAEAGATSPPDGEGDGRSDSAVGRLPNISGMASELADAPPGERQVIIESMVEGLAKRLEEDPGDAEGWMMLARSYSVLGRPKEALDRLKSAIANEPKETRLRFELEQLAVRIFGKEALE
jgi:cytochrome c-type biogenesis protein CcmH